MALNLGGGLFTFGAQDKGLMGALGDLRSEFKGLGKEILGLSRIQTMLAAFSFDKLDQMAGKLNQIATGGLNLTSSIEGAAQASVVSMSKLGAQMGFTAKQSREMGAQAFSMSRAIGVSSDEAGKALVGMKWATDDVKKAMDGAFGIKSATDLAKFANQTGIDVSKMAYAQTQLTKTTGLSGKAIEEMMAMATLAGAESGDVAGAINKLVDPGFTAKMLDRKNVLVGLGMSAQQATEAVAQQSKEIFALGQVFQKMGVPEGLEASTGIFDSLAQGAKDFKNLVYGANAQFPEMGKALAMVGMQQDDVIKAMQKGPAEFMGVMANAVKNVADKGGDINQVMAFVEAQLGKAMDPTQAATLAEALRDPTKRLQFLQFNTTQNANAVSDALNGMMKDAKKASTELTKSFTDSRTAAERFQMQQEDFMQRFRKMGTMKTGDFLRETAKSFKSFGDLMERTAKSGGPMALVVNKLADIQKFGAAGIFPPDMQGPLVALGATAESLISPIAKLRAAGINVMSPFGMLALAAAGLAAKFVALKAAGKTTDEALAAIGKSILNFVQVTLPKYAGMAVKGMANFIRSLFMPATKSSLPQSQKMAKAIGTQLVRAFYWSFQFAKEAVVSLWKGLTGQMTSADVLSGSDAQAIGAGIGIKLREAFDYAKKMVVNYLKNWWATMNTIWSDPNLSIGDKLQQSLLPSLPLLGGIALGLGPIVKLLRTFGPLLRIVGLALGQVGSFATFAVEVFGGLWSVLSGVASILNTVVMSVFGVSSAMATAILAVGALALGFQYFPQQTQAAVDAVANFARQVGPYIGQALTYVTELFLSLPVLMARGLLLMNQQIFGFLADFAPALGQAFFAIGEVLKALVGSILVGIRDTLASQFPAAAKPIFAVFDFITKAFDTVVGALQIGFVFIGELLGTVAYVFERTFGVAVLAFDILGQNIWAFIQNNIGPLLGWFSNLFTSIYQWGKPVFDWLASVGTYIYDALVLKLKSGINDLISVFKDFRTLIGGLFDKLEGWLKSFSSAKPAQPTAAPPAPALPPKAPSVPSPTAPATPKPPVTPTLPGTAPAGKGVGAGPKMPGAGLPINPASGAGAVAPKGGLQLPAGMAQAMQPQQTQQQIQQQQQQLNAALINAINNPTWAQTYMALSKTHHAQLLAALQQLKGTPVAKGGGAIRANAGGGGPNVPGGK